MLLDTSYIKVRFFHSTLFCFKSCVCVWSNANYKGLIFHSTLFCVCVCVCVCG